MGGRRTLLLYSLWFEETMNTSTHNTNGVRFRPERFQCGYRGGCVRKEIRHAKKGDVDTWQPPSIYPLNQTHGATHVIPGRAWTAQYSRRPVPSTPKDGAESQLGSAHLARPVLVMPPSACVPRDTPSYPRRREKNCQPAATLGGAP